MTLVIALEIGEHIQVSQKQFQIYSFMVFICNLLAKIYTKILY